MDLSKFTGTGYSKGRSKLVCALWLAVSSSIFQRWWLPSRARVSILRMFGAQIGEQVLVRHRVRVHWPWKLSIGDDVWIGEGSWILNLEQVSVGSNVCISQNVVLCAGSHKFRSSDFRFDNGPIVVEENSWLAFGCLILRGVTVGAGSLVGASAVVARDLKPGSRVAAAESTVTIAVAKETRPG